MSGHAAAMRGGAAGTTQLAHVHLPPQRDIRSSCMHADTPSGGETAFPRTNDSDWLDLSLKPHGLSACAEGHVAVKPEIGTALLFYSMAPGAERNESLRTVDRFSLHTGCPPGEGQLKWTATIWIHCDPFRPEHFSMQYPKRQMQDPVVCKDLGGAACRVWAGACLPVRRMHSRSRCELRSKPGLTSVNINRLRAVAQSPCHGGISTAQARCGGPGRAALPALWADLPCSWQPDASSALPWQGQLSWTQQPRARGGMCAGMVAHHHLALFQCQHRCSIARRVLGRWVVRTHVLVQKEETVRRDGAT